MALMNDENVDSEETYSESESSALEPSCEHGNQLSDEKVIYPENESIKQSQFDEHKNTSGPRLSVIPKTLISNSHSYAVRPARVLLAVEDCVNCKNVSLLMQSLCFRVGLMATFDVYSTEESFISFLNSNRYDVVFIHQLLLFGPNGDSLLLNIRCLLSCTPVIIMGLSCNYGAIMSLCDFTAFLRIPFSESDFLHYLLKYIYEEYESCFLGIALQKLPKKNRLRYQVMERLSCPPTDIDYCLVGVPIALGLKPGLTEEQYLEASKFSIPDCFQISVLPEHSTTSPLAAVSVAFTPPMSLQARHVQIDHVEDIQSIKWNEASTDNTIVQSNNKPATNSRMSKKRVSAGMRVTREYVDEFVGEASNILSRITAYQINTVPQPAISVERTKRPFISIAPKVFVVCL